MERNSIMAKLKEDKGKNFLLNIFGAVDLYTRKFHIIKKLRKTVTHRCLHEKALTRNWEIKIYFNLKKSSLFDFDIRQKLNDFPKKAIVNSDFTWYMYQTSGR